VTLKQLRQLLEDDLGLERDELKSQKAELSAMIDKVRARVGRARLMKSLPRLRQRRRSSPPPPAPILHSRS
jgi:hypothetical protein